MALLDEFTFPTGQANVNLVGNHTSDSGHTWSSHPSRTGVLYSTTGLNTVRKQNTVAALLISSWLPSSADYSVKHEYAITTNIGESFYSCLRCDATADTNYFGGYANGAPGTFIISKTVAGTVFPLASVPASAAPAAGETYSVELIASGTGAQVDLVLKINGATVLTFSDTASDRVVAAGRAAIRWTGTTASTSSTGIRLDRTTAAETAGATAVITTTRPYAYDVHAMTGAGAAVTVPIVGSYANLSGTPASVEARVMNGATQVVGWTAIGGTIGSGAFAGSLVGVSAQGLAWLNLEVRLKDAGGTVLHTQAQTNLWGVGVKILLGMNSSSTFKRYAIDWVDAGTPSPFASISIDSGTVYGLVTTTGQGVASMTRKLVSIVGVPVAVVVVARAGSQITDFINDVATDGKNCRTNQNQVIAAAKPFTCGTMHCFGNDGASVVGAEATYLGYGRTLITEVRTNAGQAQLPVFFTSIQSSGGADATLRVSRRLLQTLAKEPFGHFYGSAVIYGIAADATHIDQPGYIAHGERGGATIGNWFLTGAQVEDGEIVSARRLTATTGLVRLRHHGGTDITPASGNITGFVASIDDFATMVSCTAVRSSPTTVTVTHADLGSGPRKYGYQYEAAPNTTAPLMDNQGLAMQFRETPNALVASNPLTVTVTDDSGSAALGPFYIDVEIV